MNYKKLSIIIPAYNEEKYIRQILEKVVKADSLGLKKDIVIINDGSTDKTAKIVRTLLKKYSHRHLSFYVITKKQNEGKGAAIRDGLKICSGDIIVIQDSDLEYDPSNYPVLLKPLIKNKADIVYGSRTLGIKKFGNKYSYIFFYLGGRMLTSFINLLYHTNLTDQPTGYKLFKKKLIPLLLNKNYQRDFSYEVEITASIVNNNYKIMEVPISYTPRKISDGKKINIIDFIKSLYIALRYKFE